MEQKLETHPHTKTWDWIDYLDALNTNIRIVYYRMIWKKNTIHKYSEN